MDVRGHVCMGVWVSVHRVPRFVGAWVFICCLHRHIMYIYIGWRFFAVDSARTHSAHGQSYPKTKAAKVIAMG